MKIIEITGQPYSGKTYLFDKLQKKFTDKNIIFYNKKRKLFNRLLFFIFNFHKIKKTDHILINNSISIIKNNNISLYWKILLIINTYEKIINYRCIEKKYFNTKKIIIVDEGLTHIPYNLTDYNKFDKRKLLITLNLICKYDQINIILINNKKIRRDFLKKKYHKRLETTDIKKELFLKFNKQIDHYMNNNFKNKKKKIIKVNNQLNCYSNDIQNIKKFLNE